MSDNNPKQVLLFQEDEKALGYMYRLPVGYDMENIDVKSIDYDVEEIKENYTLVGSQPTKNSVYHLHPYKKNTYIHESLGEDYFLKEKLALYKRVGQLLGAKSIATKVISIENKKREIDTNGNLQYKLVDGGVNVKNTISENYKNSLEILDTYQHQENFDLDRNITELHNIINEFNLHHEIDLISMIDARDSKNSGTILSSRHIKSEISSEYNKVLDISAKLSIPLFSVSTGFKDSLKIVNKVIVDIKFEF